MTRRGGFSLTETLVAMAVVVILAAAVIPNLVASDSRVRVERAALVLEELSDAITRARFDNQDWPNRLSHLSERITTSDQNLCGSTYTAGRVNTWNGPYFDRPFPATGLPAGIGTIRDMLDREVISGNPKGGGAVAYLRMGVDGVAEEDALELNRVVDGDGSATTGTIQWVAPNAGGVTTVTWTRTIKGC